MKYRTLHSKDHGLRSLHSSSSSSCVVVNSKSRGMSHDNYENES